MSSSNRPKSTIRLHGMHPPFHPLQVLTWFIYPLLIVQYFLLVMPLLGSMVFQIITAIVFGLSSIGAVVAGGLTATTDPADDACLRPDVERSVPTVLCYLCEAYVESTSKHCRTCGKCVQNFDHHCKWLNTCVGKKNYHYFLILMGNVAVMTTLSLGLSAYLVALCFLDRRVIKDRIDDSVVLDGILDFWAVLSLLIVSMAVLLPLVLLLYQLMGFHAMLVSRGITTYDYIVSEQKRLREKKKAAAEAQSVPKTASAVSAARSVPVQSQSAGAAASSSGGGGSVLVEMGVRKDYDKAQQEEESDIEDNDLCDESEKHDDDHDDEGANNDDDDDDHDNSGNGKREEAAQEETYVMVKSDSNPDQNGEAL